MNTTKQMPRHGQFVAVWTAPTGELMSSTLRWVDGRLHAFQEFPLNRWVPDLEDPTWYEEVNATFMTL